MTREDFDHFCSSLKATSHVIQWGGASVWKVGGKIFTICSRWEKDGNDHISFKASDLSYQILCEQDGISPAPYLARAKWVSTGMDAPLNDEEIKTYIVEAHRIIAGKLTKKLQKELGLDGI